MSQARITTAGLFLPLLIPFELAWQAVIQFAAIAVFPLKDTGPFTLQNRHVNNRSAHLS